MTDAEKIQALREDAAALARALQHAVTCLRLGRTGAANAPYYPAVLNAHKSLDSTL